MPLTKYEGLSKLSHFLKSRDSVIRNNFLEYRTSKSIFLRYFPVSIGVSILHFKGPEVEHSKNYDVFLSLNLLCCISSGSSLLAQVPIKGFPEYNNHRIFVVYETYVYCKMLHFILVFIVCQGTYYITTTGYLQCMKPMYIAQWCF